MNQSKRSSTASGLDNSKRAGRMKVVRTHFQKSGNSLSNIIQAGSYKRKVKELLKRNKELAVSHQNAKMDLACNNKLLQECSNNNVSILLAKKKLKKLVITVQELVSGINDVATCLDMKEFRYLMSDDDERKLRLPLQALDPIDENSIISESANISASECIISGKSSGLTKTPVSANTMKDGSNQAEIVKNQPEPPPLNVASDSPGTPVLCLSPLPPKRNIFSSDDMPEAPPSKRLKPPEQTAKKSSPKIGKVLSDNKSPKPDKKTPPKTSPKSSKTTIVTKSPKHSKIPQRNKIPLPEPVIKPPVLSSSSSNRKTFVIHKETTGLEDVASNNFSNAEKIIIPDIISNDTNASRNVHSIRRETFQIPRSTTVEENRAESQVFPPIPSAPVSDDMEITAVLPLIKPMSVPLPSNDDMELTSILPTHCFLNNQSNALPVKQIEQPVPEASGEKTALATDPLVALASENIMLANNEPNPTAKNKKKSLRVKKSLCAKNKEVADSEPDVNLQTGTTSSKRFSLEDAPASRKSVQFSFKECYNAFQSMKTKGDRPKSILKPSIADSQQPPSKSPESPKKATPPEEKQTCAVLQFSTSDDLEVKGLSPELFPDKSRKNTREFSGVSQRRSKKKTVSGDVFSEIDIPIVSAETSPDCLVPSLPSLVNSKTAIESESKTSQGDKSEPPQQFNKPDELAKSQDQKSPKITPEEDLATKPKEIVEGHAENAKAMEKDFLTEPVEATLDSDYNQPKKKKMKGAQKKQKGSVTPKSKAVSNTPMPHEEKDLEVEVEAASASTKECTSLGMRRERRSKTQKSYKEPSLRDKKRRE